MLLPRIIPSLLLDGHGLVKTVNFKNETYIGDPINALKIFNEKQVDEICVLDIRAAKNRTSPNISYIQELASECFMPMSYGGGISKLSEMEDLFRTGIEKIILNTAAFLNPNLIKEAAKTFGSQSIVLSLDIRKNIFGNYSAYINSGLTKTKGLLENIAVRFQDLGVGEILLHNITMEGTQSGFDLDIIKKIANNVTVPIVALGGAYEYEDLKKAILSGASAVAAGSLFVYQGKHNAVLINYPDIDMLEREILSR